MPDQDASFVTINPSASGKIKPTGKPKKFTNPIRADSNTDGKYAQFLIYGIRKPYKKAILQKEKERILDSLAYKKLANEKEKAKYLRTQMLAYITANSKALEEEMKKYYEKQKKPFKAREKSHIDHDELYRFWVAHEKTCVVRENLREVVGYNKNHNVNIKKPEGLMGGLLRGEHSALYLSKKDKKWYSSLPAGHNPSECLNITKQELEDLQKDVKVFYNTDAIERHKNAAGLQSLTAEQIIADIIAFKSSGWAQHKPPGMRIQDYKDSLEQLSTYVIFTGTYPIFFDQEGNVLDEITKLHVHGATFPKLMPGKSKDAKKYITGTYEHGIIKDSKAKAELQQVLKDFILTRLIAAEANQENIVDIVPPGAFVKGLSQETKDEIDKMLGKAIVDAVAEMEKNNPQYVKGILAHGHNVQKGMKAEKTTLSQIKNIEIQVGDHDSSQLSEFFPGQKVAVAAMNEGVGSVGNAALGDTAWNAMEENLCRMSGGMMPLVLSPACNPKIKSQSSHYKVSNGKAYGVHKGPPKDAKIVAPPIPDVHSEAKAKITSQDLKLLFYDADAKIQGPLENGIYFLNFNYQDNENLNLFLQSLGIASSQDASKAKFMQKDPRNTLKSNVALTEDDLKKLAAVIKDIKAYNPKLRSRAIQLLKQGRLKPGEAGHPGCWCDSHSKKILEHCLKDKKPASTEPNKRYDLKKDRSALENKNKSKKTSGKKKATTENKDTLDAGMELKKKVGGKKVAVLNMANATNPGGGFLPGAKAQEEAISRRSNLALRLLDDAKYPIAGRYNGGGHSGYERPEYNDDLLHGPGALYTADVRVYDYDGNPKDSLDVISSAGFSLGYEHGKRKSLTSKDSETGLVPKEILGANGNIDWEQYDALMKDKIEVMLLSAMDNDCPNLVLGPLGCGAFAYWREAHPDYKGSPKTCERVANIFEKLLTTEPYVNYFENIDFACYVPPNTAYPARDQFNLTTFQQCAAKINKKLEAKAAPAAPKPQESPKAAPKPQEPPKAAPEPPKNEHKPKVQISGKKQRQIEAGTDDTAGSSTGTGAATETREETSTSKARGPAAIKRKAERESPSSEPLSDYAPDEERTEAAADVDFETYRNYLNEQTDEHVKITRETEEQLELEIEGKTQNYRAIAKAGEIRGRAATNLTFTSSNPDDVALQNSFESFRKAGNNKIFIYYQTDSGKNRNPDVIKNAYREALKHYHNHQPEMKEPEILGIPPELKKQLEEDLGDIRDEIAREARQAAERNRANALRGSRVGGRRIDGDEELYHSNYELGMLEQLSASQNSAQADDVNPGPLHRKKHSDHEQSVGTLRKKTTSRPPSSSSLSSPSMTLGPRQGK